MEKRKLKYKLGLCKCQFCGIEFLKPMTEIRRNEKLNRPNFCGRICVGKNNTKYIINNKSDYDIKKHSSNKKDELTEFKYHFRNIKKRFKNVELELLDLKNCWENQKGICYFSGVKLKLSTHSKIIKDPIYTASLDRIDSSIGYTKNNIRWVSVAINWMKNTMSDEKTWELCNLIKENLIKKDSI